MTRAIKLLTLLSTSTLLIACPSGGRGGGGAGGGGSVGEDPELTVESPTEDGVYYADVQVPLRAVVSDEEDEVGDLLVRWTIAGEVVVEDVVPDPGGIVEGELPLLDVGSYTVTTVVEDSDGNRTSAAVDIEVGAANVPPDCAITDPAPGGFVAAGGVHVFAGTASDPEDAPEELTVELSVNNVRVGTGTVDGEGIWTAEVSGLNLGSSIVDLLVVDSVGGECTSSVQVTGSNPPTVEILFPVDNGRVNEGSDQPFTGTAIDQEDSEPQLQIVWTSDLDGTLGTDAPNTIGEVSVEGVSLSAGTHVITLQATDTDGLSASTDVTVVLNAAPGAPTVSVAPVDPGAEDTLSMVVDVDSVDPEGDAVTYTWQWFRNGSLEDFFDDSTLPSTQTNRGETWTVVVHGVDEWGAVSPSASASAEIANALPTVTEPNITPTIAYADTELTCNPGTTFDGDGDPVTLEYDWFIDGVFAATGQTLAPLSATRGQSVTCSNTPFDTIAYGLPTTSAAVTLINAPPGAPGVAITPAAPETVDTLSCAVTSASTDADSDTVTYTYSWLVDGNPSGITGQTVPATATSDQEVWTCEVTPDDGFGPGTVGTDAVSIGSVPMYLDVGTHNNNFSSTSLTRGFWFEAPVSLTITGLRVPTEVTGPQNIQVVRFTSGAPPTFSASTTAHTTLFYVAGQSGTAFIPATISIAQGDFIGILGARGTSTMNNSYRASGDYTTNFDGNSVVLSRLIYQQNLASGQAGALSGNPGGNIGRVEVEYTVP